jgi:GAF domain-containing protein
MSQPPNMPVALRSDTAEKVETESLARLNELSSRLSRMGELREGLREILSAVIELLGAGKGNIQLLDRERGVLVIEVQFGFDRDFLDTFKQISSVDESACGRALRLRRFILIEDTEADKAYAPFRAAARAAGYRAVITAPIMGGDHLPLGMISAHFPSPHRLTEPEMHLLNLYVRPAAEFIKRFKP